MLEKNTWVSKHTLQQSVNDNICCCFFFYLAFLFFFLSCLSPFFLPRFKVSSQNSPLVCMCPEIHTHTHNTVPFTQTQQPHFCSRRAVNTHSSGCFLLFFFLFSPPSPALIRKRKSSEFGTRREKIRLKQ